MRQPTDVCDRHQLPRSSDATTPESPYYVRRCEHAGNRFIVEFRSAQSDFIVLDYVEDVTPLGAELIEAHDPKPDQVDALWDALYQRLLGGDPPQPEH